MLLTQLAHHTVHVNGGEAADGAQIGLRQRQVELASVRQTDDGQSRVGLAKKVRQTRRRAQPPDTKNPLPMHRGIQHGQVPELQRQIGMLVLDDIQLAVRHHRGGDGRQGPNLVVQHLQRVGVQVDEIARHMNGHHLLPIAATVLHEAGHHAVEQQHTAVQRPVRRRDQLLRAVLAHLGDRGAQHLPLGRGQVRGALVQNKARQHGVHLRIRVGIGPCVSRRKNRQSIPPRRPWNTSTTHAARLRIAVNRRHIRSMPSRQPRTVKTAQPASQRLLPSCAGVAA